MFLNSVDKDRQLATQLPTQRRFDQRSGSSKGLPGERLLYCVTPTDQVLPRKGNMPHREEKSEGL